MSSQRTLSLISASIWLISALICLPGLALDAPYTVESKVRNDLEDAVSRLIPREQFLLQVTADVSVRSERKLVEGETIVSPMPPGQKPVTPMPGFMPDMELTTPERPVQTRQVFRQVETPVLSGVHVNVTFDDGVNPRTVSQAKRLVQNYLFENYPRLTRVTFGVMSMLKPKKDPALEEADLKKKELEKQKEEKKDKEKKEEKPPVPEDPWVTYGRWGILGALVLGLLLLFRRTFAPRSDSKNRALEAGSSQAPFYPQSFQNSPWMPGAFEALRNFSGFRSEDRSKSNLDSARRQLLEKLISRSEAFRLYYGKLDENRQKELQSILNGPAFDSLLDGLEIKADDHQVIDVPDVEERTSWHIKNFEEFVMAKDWQDRQFFGFLAGLTQEQLLSIVNAEDAETVCVMLRFLKPTQSAFVLDHLTPKKRLDVISHLSSINKLELSEIVSIENQIRSRVKNLPQHLLSPAPEELKFWGDVFSESHQQEAIFEELEKTNPEIYPKLKKYRFTLDEAAALPDSLLARVLTESDNEEVGLALSTCSTNVAETLLDALSERRRELIRSQMPSYRRVPVDVAQQARQKLTRKIREVLEA